VAGKRRKTMNMKRIVFCVLFAAVSFLMIVSCTKTGGSEADSPDQVDENDDIFPVITIDKPLANQVFNSGDSIIIEGKCTDNKIVYKGKVQLKNDATTLAVAENYYESHFLQMINFRVAYKATVTSATDYSVIVEFQDHGLNVSNTTIKVKVNP
jgi:hypothetical protein